MTALHHNGNPQANGRKFWQSCRTYQDSAVPRC